MNSKPSADPEPFFEIRGYEEPNATALNTEYDRYFRCPKCGSTVSTYKVENLRLSVRGNARQWPDIFNSGFLILSEHVVSALEENQFRGFRAHSVVIEEIQSLALKKQPRPEYFSIEITGRIDIALDQLDAYGGAVCPVCFSHHPPKINGKFDFRTNKIPRLETWKGEDFVTIRNLYTKLRYCSKRFVELASQNRWTNFDFGSSIPSGIRLLEDPPSDSLSYLDPAWESKAEEILRKKHSDFFGS